VGAFGVPTWAWVVAASAGVVAFVVAAWRQRPLRPAPVAAVPFAGAILSTVLIGEVRAGAQVVTAVAVLYLLSTRGRPLDLLPAAFLTFSDEAAREEHARHHHRSDVALRWLVGVLVVVVVVWVIRVLTAG
jgi:hypothetical protein